MDSNYADLPDELWERIKVWIPTEAPNPKGGQRPIDDRRVMSGIIYRLRTGC
jgi:transposase